MTIAMDGRDNLEALVDEVEDVIAALVVSDDASQATAFTLLDRTDQWEHLGVVVSAPESRNADITDGRAYDWHEDVVSVRLRCSLARTTGQRAGRNATIKHERQIRNAILNAPTLHSFSPRFLSSTRQPLPDRAWLEIDQRIGFGRFDRVSA